MSATYPLPKGTRQVVPDYAADGSTTVAFAIPFRFFDPTDIWVGHRAAGSTAAFVQNTLGTDYSISGAGLEAGGTATFFAPPPAGLVRVMGLRTPSRLTNTVNDSAINSAALENELDVQEMTLQEIRRDMSALMAFFAAIYGPPPAALASKYIGFDSSGNLTLVVAASGALIPGAVTARQFRLALAASNLVPAVVAGIPADTDDGANIAWFGGAIVSPSDALWTNVKTTLGYSGAQMIALMTLAATEPP